MFTLWVMVLQTIAFSLFATLPIYHITSRLSRLPAYTDKSEYPENILCCISGKSNPGALPGEEQTRILPSETRTLLRTRSTVYWEMLCALAFLLPSIALCFALRTALFASALAALFSPWHCIHLS